MEVDEFLDKIENGENLEKEKPKTEIDRLIEELGDKNSDKIAVCDRIVSELENHRKALDDEWRRTEPKVARIKEALLEIRSKLNASDIHAAKKLMDEINDAMIFVSDEFIDVRESLKKDIAQTESVFLSKLIEFEKKDYERKERIILMSIAQAKKFVGEKKVEAAISEYRRCQDVYHSLPDGFSQKKAELYERIVGIYKEIIIAAQISSLQNKLDI